MADSLSFPHAFKITLMGASDSNLFNKGKLLRTVMVRATSREFADGCGAPCRVRVSRGHDYEFSHHAAFDRLLKDGCEPMDIYHAICTQARVLLILGCACQW